MITRAVYVDHAATTPVRPEVLEAMLPYLTESTFGNPSSAHRFGRAARAGLEHASQQIASALGVRPVNVVFTSGGTEADNLAVIGGALAAQRAGRPFRVAVSGVEHKAVLTAAEALERVGGETVILQVDGQGRVDLDGLEETLERGVALVSVMWVNNETGVTQDVPAIAAQCTRAGTPLHTDAVQGVGKLDCSADGGGWSLLTISGHKLGAPKGIGALIVSNQDLIEPMLHGGAQQGGLRPGTENVPGIVGLGRAVELAVETHHETASREATLRDELERRIEQAVPDVVIQGRDAPRAPHISNMSVPGTDSEALLMHLDLAGVACSSGSACSTGAIEPSHVLTAMGVERHMAIGTLRFSFGSESRSEDVEHVADTLPNVVGKVRQLASVLRR